jgi:hypothetical protein
VICDQTVGNILERHGLPPAPERKRTTPWPAFIRTHLALLAGTDFFTAEVLTLRGLVTYYVLFFIHLESRKVDIAGITIHHLGPRCATRQYGPCCGRWPPSARRRDRTGWLGRQDSNLGMAESKSTCSALHFNDHSEKFAKHFHPFSINGWAPIPNVRSPGLRKVAAAPAIFPFVAQSHIHNCCLRFVARRRRATRVQRFDVFGA